MSLTKILKAPVKLFRKDVITFLIIRRHDLGILEDKLRYLAVKPNSSVFVLRQKIWHLLDLPDYCEEVIILKSSDETEVPLTELRKGNSPQRPFILEVCLPGSKPQLTTTFTCNNMLTIGNGESVVDSESDGKILDQLNCNAMSANQNAQSTTSADALSLRNYRIPANNCMKFLSADYKKSDLACRISSTSIFKLNFKKNHDSVTNILLKIQSDLCTLSTKLSNLENRIPA
ncbi:hypothetical protein ACJJTC_018831 [Scirpophaga incertulas]